jgi:capsular exopolysaccharide synthesis family protein
VIGRFKADSSPAFSDELQTPSSEAYRQLRTNVHFTGLGNELRTIVITSAYPDEGKSTTAANLATVLAQAGERVILVDTDLRRSSLRRTFDGPTSSGLTGLLLNDFKDPELALVATRWKNLRLLPAGVLPPNPSELLTSPRMGRIIGGLRGLADYVIFDTPPVLAVTDAIVLAAKTDGTILVTEAGRTRTEALRQAVRTLDQAKVRTVGIVLNKANIRRRDYYYYNNDAGKKPVEDLAKTPATPPSAALEVPSIEPRREPAPMPPAAMSQPAAPVERPAAFEPALKTPIDGSLERRLAALRSLHYRNTQSPITEIVAGPPVAALAATTGRPVASPAAANGAPAADSISELLSRLDDTMVMIRSLKPGSNGKEA